MSTIAASTATVPAPAAPTAEPAATKTDHPKSAAGGGGGRPAAPMPQAHADPADTTPAAAARGDAAGTLDAVGSLFSGWMVSAASAAAAAAAAVASSAASSSTSTSTTTAGDGVAAWAPAHAPAPDRSAPGTHDTTTDPVAAPAAANANEAPNPNAWLEGAGKMWESALRDVGERMEAVKLEETVAGLRESSTLFLDDVSKNIQTNLHLDPDLLRARADELQTSTKVLLASASEKIHERTREAMEIFVDKADTEHKIATADRASGIRGQAPWDKALLPEAEHLYADRLREEMLKLVAESIYSKKKRTEYFLSGAAGHANFQFDADANASVAIAALDADPNMRRLRAGLVPQKIKENVFWDEYFYRISHVRALLVANHGVMPALQSLADGDEKSIFGEDDDDDYEELHSLDRTNAPPTTNTMRSPEDSSASKIPIAATCASGADGAEISGRDWEGEIDALFDSKE